MYLHDDARRQPFWLAVPTLGRFALHRFVLMTTQSGGEVGGVGRRDQPLADVLQVVSGSDMSFQCAYPRQDPLVSISKAQNPKSRTVGKLGTGQPWRAEMRLRSWGENLVIGPWPDFGMSIGLFFGSGFGDLAIQLFFSRLKMKREVKGCFSAVFAGILTVYLV